MSLPQVGVVIPVYNAAGTVPRAVTSALRQRDVDVRVFAVDHGSRDGSLDRLRALAEADDRVDVQALTRRPGERLSAARPLNHGVAKAVAALPRGWILRLDADDVLADDHVLSDALQAGGLRPVIAGMLTLYHPEDGTAIRYGPRADLRDRGSLVRGAAYALGHHAMLTRTDVLAPLLERAPLFNETISYGEDLDASLRILSAVTDERFAFVPTSLTYKFLGPGTITSTLPVRTLWWDQLRIFARHRRMSWSLFARLSGHLALRALGEGVQALQERVGTPAAGVGALDPGDIGPVLSRLRELTAMSGAGK